MGEIDVTKVEEIIEKNPGGQETLITIMHAVQDMFGYVPRQALIVISQKKNVFHEHAVPPCNLLCRIPA